jgi:hypothetical protein
MGNSNQAVLTFLSARERKPRASSDGLCSCPVIKSNFTSLSRFGPTHQHIQDAPSSKIVSVHITNVFLRITKIGYQFQNLNSIKSQSRTYGPKTLLGLS